MWQFPENLGIARERGEHGNSGVPETKRTFEEGGVVSSVTYLKGQDKICSECFGLNYKEVIGDLDWHLQRGGGDRSQTS